jgi:peptide/nickel transport system ATP-binding protein
MKLEIRDLKVDISGRSILDIDRLACDVGEVVAIAGESGSGKSMTLASIIGLIPSKDVTVSGSIRLDKMELLGLSQRSLRDIRGRRIAMIMQDPASAFSPVMRVGTLFTEALRLHGERSRRRAVERSEEAVASLMVQPQVLRRYPHQLSGGQLQRVAIALAVALNAEVLLADEPTSALDVTVQAGILGILRELRDTHGLAVLLVTHDLGVVAEVADRLAVLRSGRIVEEGPATTVLAAPQNSYTRSLVEAVPALSTDHRPGVGHA